MAEKELMVNDMNIGGVYIRKFQDLHRDSIPGRWTSISFDKAPHKPLLLLCIMDLYQQDLIRENRIEPTLHLEEMFNSYWRRLFGNDTTSTFALPFFHLQYDGFWRLEGTNGTQVSDPAIAKAPSPLRKNVAFAKLDPDLHDLLRQPEWNRHLWSVTITGSFEPEIHSRLIKTE